MTKIKFQCWGMFFIPLLLLACNKEEFQIRNTVSAKINDIDWAEDSLIVTGSYRVSPTRMIPLLSLVSMGENLILGEIETLGFWNIDLTSLKKQKVYFHPSGQSPESTSKLFAIYIFAEYDLIIKDYEVLEMEGIDNWIQLDEIKKDKIKGRFEVALKVARGATNWTRLNRPDTLYFTDGVFEAEYQQ